MVAAVVEEEVLTEVVVVVVEADLEVVVEVDLEVVVEADLVGVEEAEVDLTETKTMAHLNMLSHWGSSCTPVRMRLSVNV